MDGSNSRVRAYVGDVITMNPDGPRAEALVTEGDSIAFVGDRDGAIAVAGPDAEVIELGPGQAMLPGFIDGHSHLGVVALFNSFVDLTPEPVGKIGGIPDLVAALRESLPEAQARGWVLGAGYDDALMAEHRHPTRYDLDQVSVDLPVVVVHASGHLAALNSRALEVCSIQASTPNPSGGVIRRRRGSHEPNGVLEEHAWMDLVVPHLPRPEPSDAVRDLIAAQGQYAAQGFTTVQEGLTDPAILALLLGADKAGAITLDVVAYPGWTTADQMLAGRAPSDGYVGRVRIGGVKIVLDGSPQGKTAWLTRPYLIPPDGVPADYRGYPALEDDYVVGVLNRHHQAGWQVLAHCNGDAAAGQFIDAARAARGARGDGASGDPRDFVMIHAQTVRDDQLDEMAALGMMPSFFITHVYYWGDWHRDSVLGPERAARISPLRSALDRGIRFSLHNDSPVAPIRSMMLISSAVNRRTLSGRELGPDQRASVEEALRAMTIDAAWQYGEDDRKGSLEVGKQADLVVLSGDPLAADAADLADIAIVRTVSRGRDVFSA